jgi:phosphoglycerol geranylgeranyltransferase
MITYNILLNTIKNRGAAYFILIDPAKFDEEKLAEFVKYCETAGADGFLAGGSILLNDKFYKCVSVIKQNTSLPVIIFPGNVYQISTSADAILFLSVISGRNSEDLIGKHVTAAPVIKNSGIEPISTGYILVESGSLTAVQYISGSLPVPADKPDIAAATALAAEYLGMKLIYLEAGSGAKKPVPDDMIIRVKEYCSLPVIVGGGIKDPLTAKRKVECGADVVVTGNFFEDESNWGLIREFAEAVHFKEKVKYKKDIIHA